MLVIEEEKLYDGKFDLSGSTIVMLGSGIPSFGMVKCIEDPEELDFICSDNITYILCGRDRNKFKRKLGDIKCQQI